MNVPILLGKIISLHSSQYRSVAGTEVADTEVADTEVAGTEVTEGKEVDVEYIEEDIVKCKEDKSQHTV
jgi:hypothetical protein